MIQPEELAHEREAAAMTEATSGDRQPRFQLVEEIEELSAEENFPDYEFSFSDSKFSSDVYEVTTDMRVRGVLSAVHQACGEEADDLPASSNPAKRVDKRLRERVAISDRKVPRSELFDEDIVVQAVLEKLRESNHPVSQALDQLRIRYDEDTLSTFDYQQTVAGVIKATHEKLFKEVYDEKVKEARSSSKSE